jgi:hypothetical protein
VHFGEGESELFPLDENMFMPAKSSVKVEPEVFDFVRLRELHIVDMDRWAGLVVKMTWDDLLSLAFILHFLSQR